MKQSPDNFWLVLSVRLYENLIFTLPREFRQNYAAEMRLVFRDCCREAYHRRGFSGIIGELTGSVLDLVINAVKERTLILVDDKANLSFFLMTTTAIAAGIFAALVNLRGNDTPNPLLLILTFGFALGFIHPRSFWFFGSLIGLMIPAIHSLALVRGWQVNYPTDSATPLWAFLTLIPALLSSVVGAGFRLILNYLWKRFY